MAEFLMALLLGVVIGLFAGHLFFNGRVDELEEIVALLMNKLDDSDETK
nr:MAG TPA: Protein of unknown function (DUF1043) [Caudoviricetes sp.]